MGMHADGLSRLPLLQEESDKDGQTAALFNIYQIGTLPVKPEVLRQETARDLKLSKVLTFMSQGWPEKLEPDLQHYFTRRSELSLEAGCLLWGIKVVVPPKLQKQVLVELHTSHPGIVKMKSLARTHVWWPGIDRDIESMVKQCSSCQSLRNKPPVMALHPWNWPAKPWQRIHINYAGPFFNKMFLIVVDAHSKWPEVVPVTSATSEKTITELRKMFATHGQL